MNSVPGSSHFAERGCVRSTSRSASIRQTLHVADVLRLVETTQSRSGFKMRIAVPSRLTWRRIFRSYGRVKNTIPYEIQSHSTRFS